MSQVKLLTLCRAVLARAFMTIELVQLYLTIELVQLYGECREGSGLFIPFREALRLARNARPFDLASLYYIGIFDFAQAW